MTDNSDAALQVTEDEQVEGACVCCAHVCVPCVHVCCGARSVRSLCLFHRVAQSGKQQCGWVVPHRGLAYKRLRRVDVGQCWPGVFVSDQRALPLLSLSLARVNK